MFESISNSLQKVFERFSGARRLTAENIQEGLREIRTALLEADVNFKVAKDLIRKVTEKAVGEEVVRSDSSSTLGLASSSLPLILFLLVSPPSDAAFSA